jgi:hypothetical protein
MYLLIKWCEGWSHVAIKLKSLHLAATLLAFNYRIFELVQSVIS